MREMSIQEMRTVQMDLLDRFDRACKENGLTYSLCGGTLIGAVRHGGYIPWDDDIDVMMPRPDYDRFIRLRFEEPYLLEAPELLGKEKTYVYMYAKLYNTGTVLIEDPHMKRLESHVYIDVFPLDAIADDQETWEKEFYRIRKHIWNYITMEQADSFLQVKGLSLPRKVKWHAASIRRKLLPARDDYYKALEIIRSRDYDSARFTGHPLSEARPLYRYPKEIMIMDNHVVFEGKEYSAMHDYEAFLRIHYGDYMQLPPEEERVRHDNIAWFLDD